MVQTERSLRDITASTALAVIVLGGTLLLVAVLAELQRRRTSQSRFVLVADRLLPSAASRAAIAFLSVLAAVATFVGPQAASADTSVRDWLTDPTTTTSEPAPASTPTTLPRLQNDRRAAVEPPTSPPTARSAPSHTESPTPAVATPPATAVPSAPRAAPVVHTPSVSASNPVDAAPPQTPIAASSRTQPVEPPTAGPDANGSPYQVVTGDCLWTIAGRVLGANVSSSAIDRGWRAIYAANRAAIGDDPNLIHPGLLLTLPPLTATP